MAIENKLVKIKILVADDEDRFALMIQEALMKAGFLVVRAKDGEEAIRLIKAERPALVLLDIMMPEKLGFEVLEEVRKDQNLRGMPIITLSHLAQSSDIEKVKRLGVVRHLVKSDVSLRDIVDAVSKALSMGRE